MIDDRNLLAQNRLFYWESMLKSDRRKLECVKYSPVNGDIDRDLDDIASHWMEVFPMDIEDYPIVDFISKFGYCIMEYEQRFMEENGLAPGAIDNYKFVHSQMVNWCMNEGGTI